MRSWARWKPLSHHLAPRRVHTSRLADSRPHGHDSTIEQRLPLIAQPRFWTILIPKSWRTKQDARDEKAKRGRNPALFYVVMTLLLASHGIRMGGLRNEYTQYSRKVDARLAQLRDVLERLKRGEDVDVEAALGTGKPQDEQDWEDGESVSWCFDPLMAVIREIEEDDKLFGQDSRQD